MLNLIKYNPDGSLKPKIHYIMLREACAEEDIEELDNIINTYDDNT